VAIAKPDQTDYIHHNRRHGNHSTTHPRKIPRKEVATSARGTTQPCRTSQARQHGIHPPRHFHTKGTAHSSATTACSAHTFNEAGSRDGKGEPERRLPGGGVPIAARRGMKAPALTFLWLASPSASDVVTIGGWPEAATPTRFCAQSKTARCFRSTGSPNTKTRGPSGGGRSTANNKDRQYSSQPVLLGTVKLKGRGLE